MPDRGRGQGVGLEPSRYFSHRFFRFIPIISYDLGIFLTKNYENRAAFFSPPRPHSLRTVWRDIA